MKILSLFIWVLVPLALWGGYERYGTPHLVLSYTFYDNGNRYNPRAYRHYIDCTYVGWTGVRKVYAIDARCPWVRFLKERA